MSESILSQPAPCFILLGTLITGMLSFAVLLTKDYVIKMFHWPLRLAMAYLGMELWFVTLAALLWKIIRFPMEEAQNLPVALDAEKNPAQVLTMLSGAALPPDLTSMLDLERTIMYLVGCIAMGLGLFCFRIIVTVNPPRTF